MGSNNPALGPQYWSQRWGFDTFAEFKAGTARFISSPLPFGNFGANEAALELAYLSPLIGIGPYLVGRLISSGYTDDASSSGLSVSQELLNIALLIEQETSVGTLIIPNCFQVTMQAQVAGHVVENVIGLLNGGGSSSGAAAAVKTAWEQSGGPLELLRTDVAMVNYHAVDIGSSTGGITDLASTTAGSSTSGALSTRASCALVKWNGSSRSRSTRGRMYIGPLTDNNLQSDGGTLNATFASDLSDAVQAFRDSLTFLGYPLQVLSRTLNEATPVSAHAIEAVCATQRRRLRG